ncbi:MAG: hypothetical protein ACREBJ_11080 [Nitrosotalea sp.]
MSKWLKDRHGYYACNVEKCPRVFLNEKDVIAHVKEDHTKTNAEILKDLRDKMDNSNDKEKR